MSEPVTAEQVDGFLKTYHAANQALVARLETRVEYLEMLLSQMTIGYADLTSMVQALITLGEHEGSEKFAQLFAENKKKMLQLLDAGYTNAEVEADRFVSHGGDTDSGSA